MTDRRTVLIVSEQPVFRAGNQVLRLTVLENLRAGYDVILVLRRWRGNTVADPEEIFREFPGRVRVVEFSRLGDGIRDWLLRRRPRRASDAGAGEGFPAADQVVRFTATFRTYRLLSLLGSLGYLASALSAGARATAGRRIDLVIGYEALAAPVARLLASRLGVPLVLKYAGTFLGTFHPSRWRMFVNFPVHYLGTMLPCDLAIIEEDGTRGREVLLRLGHPEHRIRSWIGGVPRDFRIPGFDRRPVLERLGLGPRTKLILTTSHLTAWKRIDRAVAALPQVISEEPHARLVVANDGPERQRLEYLARSLGVSENVVFTGAVPQSEVRFLLNACDVFLNVNDNSNLSNTVLEALVCGKPVVSIDDGSTCGLLQHELNALLVPVPELGAGLSRAILRLLAEPALREALSRGALETAEARLLSWDERMDLEMSEIRKLLPN